MATSREEKGGVLPVGAPTPRLVYEQEWGEAQRDTYIVSLSKAFYIGST
jgi:hypothetical protein